MWKAAYIARITAAVGSALYMVLLLPHFAGIEAEHFTSGWFLGGFAIALAWIPLLLFRRYLAAGGGMRRMMLSFAPLVLMITYFGTLLSTAG